MKPSFSTVYMALQRQHQWAVLGCLLSLLGACAPRAGRPAILYQATPSQISSVIVATAQSETCGFGFNYYTLTGITDLSVSLKSTPTTGAAILNALGGVRSQECIMVWSMVARSSGVTAVAVNSSLSSGQYQDFSTQENKFFAALDQQFQRVVSP